jgi:beta-N-acetylhexosaminidase
MSPTGLRRHIGQLLIAGFDGPALPVEIKSLAREFGLGGVILFARNLAEPEQIAELCFEAARLDADLPAWVSIDQEGGRVARLTSPFTEFPPLATIGRSGDAGLAARFGRAMALELKAVGVSLDYAPVLDILTNPDNPVIGDRALSDQPEVVARLGAAIVHALQDAGIAACGKHFPGHGDTGSDSHLELPLLEHPIERLRQVELVPFRAAIDAGVASIMTAHVFLPAIDEQRPATLSKRIVSGLLREELKFDGLILSDDLEMKAVAAQYAVPEAAVLAVEAGCDGVLICSGDHTAQAAALEALIHAVENEEIPLARIDNAIRRQRRAKERFLAAGAATRPPLARQLRERIGLDEYRAIAEEMGRYL